MNSTNIHFLKESAQNAKAGRPRALEYLDAAHAKLVQLQTWRRQYKIDFAECERQRDTALQELKESKSIAARHSAALEEYDTIIKAQAELIRELRTEHEAAQSEKTRPARVRWSEAGGPGLTALALHRHDQQAADNQPDHTRTGKGQSANRLTRLSDAVKHRFKF